MTSESLEVPEIKSMEPSANGSLHYIEVSNKKSVVIKSNLE